MNDLSAGLHKVVLYDDGAGGSLDYEELVSYLSRVKGVSASYGGDVTCVLNDISEDERTAGLRTVEELAAALARTRICDINRCDSFEEPLPAEVAFLVRQLKRTSEPRHGHLYDGLAVMGVYRSLLRPAEELPIVFTSQLVGSWDDGDLRYHARVLIAGCPAIVSVPGVVLAPARPREYYLYQHSARAAGVSHDEIELRMRQVMGERYVAHGDPRIPEIVKGYALQAVAYWFFGEAFCDDPDCRLFNAHWQEQMLRAQLGGGYELCARHLGLLIG